MTHRWRLDHQTALVTGASKGIGLATVRELLGLGADVLMVARDEAHLQQMRDELQEEFAARAVYAFAADVSDREQRLDVFDWINDLGVELHLLVNNAGTNVSRHAVDYGEHDLSSILETNTVATFEISRLAHPLLSVHGNAAIVNVASVSGLTHVRTGAPYGMSKAAVVQLTKNLACEWASDGIRVNAVAPWYIRTGRTGPALAERSYLDEVLERTPMGRIGEPEEVAAAIAFLCMPCASYITGECVAVDGGFLRYGF